MKNKPGLYQKVRSVLLKTIAEFYPKYINNYETTTWFAKQFILNSAVYFAGGSSLSKFPQDERIVDLQIYVDKLVNSTNLPTNKVEFKSEDFFEFLYHNAASSNIYTLIEKKCFLPVSKHYNSYLIPGLIYEQLLRFDNLYQVEGDLQPSNRNKKTTGVYYTPPVLAQRIITKVWNVYCDQSKNGEFQFPIVLDLTCGTGVFTHLMIDLFLEVSKQRNYIEEAAIFDVILNNLHGIDIDNSAIELLKIIIAFKLINKSDRFTYAEISKILDEKFRVQNILFLKDHDKTYDIILSNPPYVSLYSRQSAKTSVDSKTAKKIATDSIGHSKQKRRNLSMYILDFGFRYTKEMGLFAFIHDINFFERPFDNIRTDSTQHFHPSQIEINIAGFSGVNSGQTIVLMEKSVTDVKKKILVEDFQDAKIYSISVEQFKKGAVFIDETRFSKMAKLETYPKLVDFVQIRTGVNIGGSFEKFIFEKKISSDYYPFAVSGSITGRYEPLAPATSFIRFDIEFQNEMNKVARFEGNSNRIVLGNLSRFTGEKIFLRQSDDRLCATFVPHEVVAPYSMFVIYQSDVYPLKFILALLNSTFLTSYAKYTGIIRNSRGKQPQIRKAGLLTLPIPPEVRPDSVTEIVNMVDSIINSYALGDSESISEMERVLDIKIDELYEGPADALEVR